MKFILYNGISVDGFIANSDGDSEFVNQDELFEKYCNECIAVVIGRTTFEQYSDVFPIKNVINIVMSGDVTFKPNGNFDNVFVAHNFNEVIDIASKVKKTDIEKIHELEDSLPLKNPHLYHPKNLEDDSKESSTSFIDAVMIVGGSTTSSSFLSANMIDEIIIDVYPILLRNGIKLFQSGTQKHLNLLSTHMITPDILELRYEVVKLTKNY